MIIPMTDDERRLTEEYLYLVPEMVKKLTPVVLMSHTMSSKTFCKPET